MQNAADDADETMNNQQQEVQYAGEEATEGVQDQEMGDSRQDAGQDSDALSDSQKSTGEKRNATGAEHDTTEGTGERDERTADRLGSEERKRSAPRGADVQDENITGKAGEAAEGIQSASRETGDRAKDQAEEGAGQAGETADQGMEDVEGTAEKGADKAGDTTNQAVEGGEEGAEKTTGEAGVVAGKGMEEADKTAAEGVGDADDVAEEKMEDVDNAADEGAEEVGDAADKGMEEAEEADDKLDFSILKDTQVNKGGNLVNDKGDIMGRLKEGDAKKLLGLVADEKGQIWNKSGKVVGQAEPIPGDEREGMSKDFAPFENFPDAVVEADGRVMCDGRQVGAVVEGDPKRMKGSKVDEDGDILDRRGNTIGKAEAWDEPEEVPEEETDMSSLAGKRVNKAGNIAWNGVAVAFVDDFTAWVAGPTAKDNRAGIESIINTALDWERRSGATFEAEKTAIIHFTKSQYKSDSESFTVKGQEVRPRPHVKILGLVMDTHLKYKEHIARAASKGLEATMELKRLKGLSPATARQLFTAMVAPVVDYASNVWRHSCNGKKAKWLDRVQKIGAQAITGAFRTVAIAVAEAEAHISSVQDRLWKRAMRLWVELHTLPDSNPLRREASKMVRVWKNGFQSPFQQVAIAFNCAGFENLETIQPFTLTPWQTRLPIILDEGEGTADNNSAATVVAVSSSARNGVVGVGGVARLPGLDDKTFAFTLGLREEQNPYSGELAAIAYVLRRTLSDQCDSDITVITCNKAAALAIHQPRQQSGQEYIRSIYDSVDALRGRRNKIAIRWVRAREENKLLQGAKREAKSMTEAGAVPERQFPAMRSTTMTIMRSKLPLSACLTTRIGKYSKRIDHALPGRHTKEIYDQLNRREASVLVQLRTGMARLNDYLHLISSAPTALCDCGRAQETVEHFLFTCVRWTEQRRTLLEVTTTQRGNLSFYLGGKARTDKDTWKPDMRAVRATIKFAITTGRLEAH